MLFSCVSQFSVDRGNLIYFCVCSRSPEPLHLSSRVFTKLCFTYLRIVPSFLSCIHIGSCVLCHHCFWSSATVSPGHELTIGLYESGHPPPPPPFISHLGPHFALKLISKMIMKPCKDMKDFVRIGLEFFFFPAIL